MQLLETFWCRECVTTQRRRELIRLERSSFVVQLLQIENDFISLPQMPNKGRENRLRDL